MFPCFYSNFSSSTRVNSSSPFCCSPFLKNAVFIHQSIPVRLLFLFSWLMLSYTGCNKSYYVDKTGILVQLETQSSTVVRIIWLCCTVAISVRALTPAIITSYCTGFYLRMYGIYFSITVFHPLQEPSTLVCTHREECRASQMGPSELSVKRNHLFCTSQGLKLFICKSVCRDSSLCVCVRVPICWRVKESSFNHR